MAAIPVPIADCISIGPRYEFISILSLNIASIQSGHGILDFTPRLLVARFVIEGDATIAHLLPAYISLPFKPTIAWALEINTLILDDQSDFDPLGLKVYGS